MNKRKYESGLKFEKGKIAKVLKSQKKNNNIILCHKLWKIAPTPIAQMQRFS